MHDQILRIFKFFREIQNILYLNAILLVQTQTAFLQTYIYHVVKQRSALTSVPERRKKDLKNG